MPGSWDAECSTNSKDVQYIFDDSNIKAVRDISVVVSDNDKLEGETMVPPLSTLNIPKIMDLLYKLSKLKGTPTDEAVNQPLERTWRLIKINLRMVRGPR